MNPAIAEYLRKVPSILPYLSRSRMVNNAPREVKLALQQKNHYPEKINSILNSSLERVFENLAVICPSSVEVCRFAF